MKIRLLVVGADSDYAIERPYRTYLASQSCISSVDFFPAQNIFLEYYSRSLLNKLLYRLGLSRILYKVNKQLLELSGLVKPDVILIFKGMEIFPSTLGRLKMQGIKLVNYNPDNPYVFSGKGSGNGNITRSIGLFDLYLTYDHVVCRRLREISKVNSALLPFGFDLSEELYQKCISQEEVLLPCFIGNADNQRLSFINDLAVRGIELDVYGMNWNEHKLHSNIHLKGYASGENLWRNLRRYRVQLNLMRLHNPASHNMRSFEIPAVGGIQLAPDTPDHREYFQVGDEVFLYRDSEDCAAKIRWLLALSSGEAMTIRQRARKRCLESGYSYEDRAESLAFHIMKLFPETGPI